jgi:hypothetical protein
MLVFLSQSHPFATSPIPQHGSRFDLVDTIIFDINLCHTILILFRSCTFGIVALIVLSIIADQAWCVVASNSVWAEINDRRTIHHFHVNIGFLCVIGMVGVVVVETGRRSDVI